MRFAWTLLLLPVFWAPATAFASGFGDRSLVRAKDALDAGRDSRALLLLQRALDDLAPASDMAHQARFLAARASLRLGLYESGLAYLRGLESDLVEVDDYVHYHRAHALRGLGRWNEALAQWRRVSWRSPLAPDVAFSIADAYSALRRYDQAAEAYDNALERHRRHDRASTARFARARVAERLRDYETAGELYKEIAFRAPLDYFAGESLRRFERLSARRRIAPAGFYDYLGRADRFLSARAVQRARAELDRIAPRATRVSLKRSLQERRAKLAYREDRFEQARGMFDALARQTSGARRIRHLQWASRSLAAQNRFAEAVDVYDSLAEQYRDENEGRELLFKAAWLAYNGGDHARSLALFRRFVERYGAEHDVDDATWFLAWNAYRLGDNPSALRALRSLRNRYPRSKLIQRTHYWEARILERSERAAEAARAYRSAVEHDPTSYYAILSDRRLETLAKREAPGAPTHATLADLERTTLASVGEQPRSYAEDFAPRDSREPRMPWDGAVFDWSGADGKRALRLMTLGFKGDATELVRRLKPLTGLDEDDVRYARARLLHSLGDFHAAYRIALTHFRDETSGGYAPGVRDTFEMLYPMAHASLVESAEDEWGLSPLLLLSVIRQESAFDDRARSWASARGLMQIIPPTAKRIADALEFDDFHPGLLNDPEINVRFGAWYLRALLDTYQGHPLLALGSYNAGPVAVNRWIGARGHLETDEFVEEIPYTETRGYVKRIVANLAAYHALYGGKLEIPQHVSTPDPDGIQF